VCYEAHWLELIFKFSVDEIVIANQTAPFSKIIHFISQIKPIVSGSKDHCLGPHGGRNGAGPRCIPACFAVNRTTAELVIVHGSRIHIIFHGSVTSQNKFIIFKLIYCSVELTNTCIHTL
jgi:hypothetical protein